MKAFFIILLSLISLGSMDTANKPPVQETTTYFFIRHAEKAESDPQNKDPELSDAGLKRAAEWVTYFEDVQFDMIFSTNLNRTRTTASKIADSQKKNVEFYDPKKLNDPEFRQKTLGKTVLVVGHSNTNPAFVNLILGENKYQDLDEKEYGSVFMVTVYPDGEKTSEVRYIN
ncbi:SixA phosphatase family protein [Salinimicrobium xinjiangense]|uniref:SixA phosphatase family protein n=1 Tax=Salinimicrobium xinjiangense TaxID=438596 RepID=UPI0003FDBF3A|nr:phosphoglycerate mutase family protein [Salinimicrobium xinjiangense]